MSEISIDIGQVVVNGVANPPPNPQRFGALTEAALQRLLAEQGLSPGLSSAEAPEVVVPDMSVPMHASDAQMAEALAQAIYRAISRVR